MENKSFEENLNRLKEVVRLIQSGELSLDQSIEVFKEGIELSKFHNLIKILQIKKDNVSIKFSIKNGIVCLPFDGEFVVRYSSFLTIEKLEDEIDLAEIGMNSDILLYGLSAFYCLAVGLFDEFNVYNAIYNEKGEAGKKLKISEMPFRSWN